MKKSMKKILALLLSVACTVTAIPAMGVGVVPVQAEETEDLSRSLIPLPLQYEVNEGKWTMTEDTAFYVEGRDEAETAELAEVAGYLAEKLRVSTGFALEVKAEEASDANSIVIQTTDAEEALGEEGYKIDVTGSGVVVTAYQPAGAFRAMQTLRQLLPAEAELQTLAEDTAWDMPCTSIEDKPEYSFRSSHLDVSRHFFTAEEVKRYIDNMAQYKMNKLHMHLTDDQGWRIEIKGEMYGESLSKLTTIGASTSSNINGIKAGYYTQEDFKEIVAYAADRYIEIVPEVDMPAHAWAALVSLNFLNSTEDGKPHAGKYDNTKPYEGIDVGFASLECRNEKTYEFIEEVIKQISAISPSKYFHIGGDEANSTSSEDYDYFVNRVTEIAMKYGKTPIAWQNYDQSVEDKENTITQFWKRGNSTFQKDIKYIVSPSDHAYMDMKYDSDSEFGLQWAGLTTTKKAYEWDPTDHGAKEQVYGVEACLWTETAPSIYSLDYLAYPRLPGLAEVAWTPKDMRIWSEYKLRLKDHGERMSNQGIQYYVDEDVWTEEAEPLNAQWNMDEKNGTTIYDTTGEHLGTASKGITWDEGVRGYAIAFNGSSYVDLGYKDLIGPWTASVWVKKGTCTENNAVLLSGNEGEIKIEQYKNTKKVGLTEFGVKDHVFNYTVPVDEWVMLTFVCDESTTSLYVNGVLTDTINAAINAPAKRLGANDKAGLSSAGYYTGSMDELKIFNRALTEEEIQDIYENVHTYTYEFINDTVVGTGINEFNFVGAWRTSKNYPNLFFEGNEHWFNWTNYVEGDVFPYVTMTFEGNGIEVYGNKNTMMGIYEITVDDGEPVEVDAYATQRHTRCMLFAVDGLSNGTHTIKIQSTQKRNAAATSSDIEVDFVKVIHDATIEDEFEIVKQPESAIVEKGTDAKVTVEATGKGLTYTWYYKNPGNVKFYASGEQFVTDGGASYTIPMYAWRNGQEVYCVVTDAYGEVLQSNTVVLTMVEDTGTIVIVEQPKDVIVDSSYMHAVVQVKATGEGLSYKWYYKNPGNVKFYESGADFVNEKGDAYAIQVAPWRDGQQVYCVITDVNGDSVQTNTVTLSIAK